MTGRPSILILYGSVRRARNGIRLVRYLERRLAARGVPHETVDPMELTLPLLDLRHHEHEADAVPEGLARLHGMIARADVVMPVTGEYNHNVPPALLNTIDHFARDWRGKPAAIVSYSTGRFAGARAAELLKLTLTAVGMPVVAGTVSVPDVAGVLAPDGTAEAPWLEAAVDKQIDDLTWWAEAVRLRRAQDERDLAAG